MQLQLYKNAKLFANNSFFLKMTVSASSVIVINFWIISLELQLTFGSYMHISSENCAHGSTVPRVDI
ncbi:hypothetical protein T4B_10739 [Trichinella pseudospiralis]|uniref:Uncharacterized protein n=1 Tax=Trichinella pseudospiralis TaxID=6337 RepID=A0A0V1KF61_TRIPS|nr:hypothetical protein T4A_8317 [Trichinella pseudospiralis]KRZ34363.1 hypothetical protein T4B_10739 [Trichinella pseudospiralis]KRZ45872.1 hypothetical protein T4C_7760 [Trichinella pseudospiralis]